MNLKKNLLRIITIILFGIILFAQSKVVYAETGKEAWLGTIPLMRSNTPHMGYSINKPGTAGAAVIWNIVKYNSSDKQSGFEDLNLYCVKAGIGFTQTDINNEQKPVKYDTTYDMKTLNKLGEPEKSALNKVIKELVYGSSDGPVKEGGTITEDGGVTYNRYNALLAVLDKLYLPGESDSSERQAIIDKIMAYAKVPENGYTDGKIDIINRYPNSLTDNDINAVQQAAIWYFSNYGEQENKYDKTDDTGWIYYSLTGTLTSADNDYKSMNNYTPNGLSQTQDEGQAREYQMEILYKCLINEAKANAHLYEDASSQVGAPAVLNTKTLGQERSGENTIIGPINITKTEINKDYTIEFKVTNTKGNVSYTLLDSSKKPATGKTVKDLVGGNFYISVPTSNTNGLTASVAIKYSDKTMTLWTSSQNDNEQPIVEIKTETKGEPVVLNLEAPFDLALRKYITKINGTELSQEESRVPDIDPSGIATSKTTAIYKHRKDPVFVSIGDVVTYKLTIYNEGGKKGRAVKLVDQLPTGLEYKQVVSGGPFVEESYNSTTNTLYLKRADGNNENLAAYTGSGQLASETVEVECTVVGAPKDGVLTNVAWISEEYNDDDKKQIVNEKGLDIDSEPGNHPNVNKDNMSSYKGKTSNKNDLTDSNFYYEGEQDDDDFEKLYVAFDLKLIKFITAVNDKEVPERIESVDTSKLNRYDDNGKLVTTADYKLNKDPVPVKKGDIVTYTFRIFNEGTVDGYAKEITEDVPEGLEFLWSEKSGEELNSDTSLTDAEKEAIDFNQNYLWGFETSDIDASGKVTMIRTQYLSKENETTENGNLIEAFGKNDGTKTEDDLKYKEISVKFKVISDDTTGKVIRNEAAITEDTDKDDKPIDDRDSDTEDWKKYEDDEDYDNVVLQSFDLALRKFIIATSKDETVENDEYLKNSDGSYTRAPVVDTSKLNTTDENGNLITTATYNHTKEPVVIGPNYTVVYMLRVYNEGNADGYASEIKDHLPPYLEFIDNDYNKQYGWEVSEDGRTVTTRYLENELIKAAAVKEDGTIELSYKEVPIMCRVTDEAKTDENITNIADITEYLDEEKEPATDRDSTQDNVKLPEDKDLPGYKENEKGPYVPGQEDDDDFEKVLIKSFDLALRKWVTQAIVIDNGKQTITQTGHKPYDDPEQVVKVEIVQSRLNKVTVKFRYSIRVTNEGEVEGYAKEITDYVPKGLKFVAADNPGWKDEGNNVISTRLLENTLLTPGNYADVEVVLTWINGESGLGTVLTNKAEISEDENPYGIPDKDSTPDNKKDGEDDIDDAPVILSIKTGQIRVYFALGFIVLITAAAGIILIKKYVL